jgi:hypothetical protein
LIRDKGEENGDIKQRRASKGNKRDTKKGTARLTTTNGLKKSNTEALKPF